MGHYRHGQRTTTNLLFTFPGKKSGLACYLGEHLLRISQHLLDNALSLVIIGARCQHGPVARNVHAEDFRGFVRSRDLFGSDREVKRTGSQFLLQCTIGNVLYHLAEPTSFGAKLYYRPHATRPETRFLTVRASILAQPDPVGEGRKPQV